MRTARRLGLAVLSTGLAFTGHDAAAFTPARSDGLHPTATVEVVLKKCLNGPSVELRRCAAMTVNHATDQIGVRASITDKDGLHDHWLVEVASAWFQRAEGSSPDNPDWTDVPYTLYRDDDGYHDRRDDAVGPLETLMCARRYRVKVAFRWKTSPNDAPTLSWMVSEEGLWTEGPECET